jgi:hypothetical protein
MKGGFRMNVFKKRAARNLAAAGLIMCLILGSASLFASETGVCEKALKRCGIDAAIAGLLSGPEMFLLYYSGCLMGYSWCLNYYMPRN